MIYVIWTHAFDLSGSFTNQYSFDTFSDKKEVVSTVVKWLDESRASIIDLGIEETEEELDNTLKDLHALLDNNDLENTDLTDMSWEIGDAEIVIHMADEYPEVLERFQDTVFAVAEDMFAEYIDADYELDEDDEDELFVLYRDICSVSNATDVNEFNRVFESCSEQLNNWSVF